MVVGGTVISSQLDLCNVAPPFPFDHQNNLQAVVWVLGASVLCGSPLDELQGLRVLSGKGSTAPRKALLAHKAVMAISMVMVSGADVSSRSIWNTIMYYYIL